jgi:hypothetical protein
LARFAINVEGFPWRRPDPQELARAAMIVK